MRDKFTRNGRVGRLSTSVGCSLCSIVLCTYVQPRPGYNNGLGCSDLVYRLVCRSRACFVSSSPARSTTDLGQFCGYFDSQNTQVPVCSQPKVYMYVGIPYFINVAQGCTVCGETRCNLHKWSENSTRQRVSMCMYMYNSSSRDLPCQCRIGRSHPKTMPARVCPQGGKNASRRSKPAWQAYPPAPSADSRACTR